MIKRKSCRKTTQRATRGTAGQETKIVKRIRCEEKGGKDTSKVETKPDSTLHARYRHMVKKGNEKVRRK